jgi:hypothetical protein
MLVATALIDPERPRELRVELVNLARPAGDRVFVRVSIDESHSVKASLHLEPEQARRLAEVLEHGADMADREPVGLIRKLVEQLAYYHGNTGNKILDDAEAWLERHDPK